MARFWFSRTWGNNTGGASASPPTPPTLAATQALATITGSDAGATNTVYSQAAASATIVTQGSRTGDGTVALTFTTPGLYFVWCVSVTAGGSAVSNVVQVAYAGTANSVQDQCLVGVQAVIQALGLTGIAGPTWLITDPLPAAQVLRLVLPADPKRLAMAVPAVLVSYGPVPETQEEGTNAQSDYGYPCLVTVVAAQNQDLATPTVATLWREQIRDAFNWLRPPLLGAAVSQPLKMCHWEPGPVIDLTLFQQANLFVSPTTIRVVTREAR